MSFDPVQMANDEREEVESYGVEDVGLSARVNADAGTRRGLHESLERRAELAREEGMTVEPLGSERNEEDPWRAREVGSTTIFPQWKMK